jgi:hypothetical protein
MCIVSALQSRDLARLVTARFMQRDGSAGIHGTNNIVRGGVCSIVNGTMRLTEKCCFGAQHKQNVLYRPPSPSPRFVRSQAKCRGLLRVSEENSGRGTRTKILNIIYEIICVAHRPL